MTETLEVLKWAHDAARDNEIVAMFWEELCKAVDEPLSASAEKVLSELCEYGGNTIANLFRGHGVDYAEVAYDVACALKPWLDDKPFSEGDIEACERYVLKRMEVQEDDLTKLIDAVRATVGSHVNSQVGKNVGEAAAKAVASAAMRQAANKVAEAAAKIVAREVGKRIARQVIAQVLRSLSLVFLAWTVIDIAGPAMRVTIPGVTYVALLRKLYHSVHA
jgi:uncharacterized protein YaaW (UPF0174 family)